MNEAALRLSAGAPRWRAPRIVIATLLLLAAGLPLYAHWAGDAFALSLGARVLVFALAATGLNIALGFGGLVSMGHAMYMGLGAYTVLIAGSAGIHAGWAHLALLALVVTPLAVAIGWVALRTRGIAFIMITLAFAQLFYFIFVSLKAYGGDEGMSLVQPSGFGPFTGERVALYYALLACLVAALVGTQRLTASRFGLVLRAARHNERRVQAIGTAVLPYHIVAYVLSALSCALAGFFLANLTGFVSPAYMAWTVSGELIAMVVLGGAGTVIGPALGAVALLLIEELLKSWTEHWMLALGPLIVAMVLGLKQGLWGTWIARRANADESKEVAP